MPTFETEIVATDSGAYVVVPPSVIAELGGKKRIPVNATFDGIPYRGSIVSMGGAEMILGVLKSIRAALGTTVTVTVENDTAERTIAVPDDLRDALEKAGLTATFDKLSFSHRRENINSINDAKRPETRARRIEQTVDRVRGAVRPAR